jgi:hypothetical protein
VYWELKIVGNADFPAKFIDAGKIHPDFKIYGRKWLDSVLAMKRYNKQKGISTVISPDMKVFKDYAFFAIVGDRDMDTDEICCSEKAKFNALPQKVAILFMLSEEGQVGIVGLHDGKFYEKCAEDPSYLRLIIKLIEKKPNVWKSLAVLLPIKELPKSKVL